MNENQIQLFNNEEFGNIRATDICGEPWFVGKDVAEVLGYSNTRDALAKHVDDEDKNTVAIHDGIQGNPNVTIISESGLYCLILGSKLPNAKKFKHWVTSEVLPSIRKHGMYAVDELIANPDLGIAALTALKEERAKTATLSAKVKMDAPKVLFAQAVETAKTSILIGDLAKLLKQNGVETGQKRLFEQLRQEGFLMKGGTSHNMPTQRSMEMGLFEVKESTVNNPDGSVRINRTTKVTGKGQTYFINKYLGAIQ